MGFLERMFGSLMGGKLGGHHGGYRGGHHGGSGHGGYGGNPGYPQGTGPSGGNPCPKCGSANASDARFCQQCGGSRSKPEPMAGRSDALAILEERYAHGEIEREEYLRKRDDLQKKQSHGQIEQDRKVKYTEIR